MDFDRPHSSHEDRAPGGLSYCVRAWNDSAGRPVARYWTVVGLGHAWSGGAGAGSYTDPRGPKATEAMFDFFDQCHLDRDRAAGAETLPVADARARRAALARALKELARSLRRQRS